MSTVRHRRDKKYVQHFGLRICGEEYNREIPRHGYWANIKMDLRHINCGHWWALVNMVIKLHVP